ncbi:methyl-CpG-binding domain protein 1b isoform 2-T10 [Menidia menidia]
MDEDAAESQTPGSAPVAENEKETTERECPETENSSEEAPVPSNETKDNPSPDAAPVEGPLAEVKEEVKSAGGEPPMDWFEPLEDDDDDDRDDDDEDDDDDANSPGRNDPEEESVAGESERSESVGGNEKPLRRRYRMHATRRKRPQRDEGWIEWPILAEGWKRKEVVRRSGSSIGQKDVYYLSPQGDRVRSRVELTTVLQGHLDLTNFDYKTGKFYAGEALPVRVRARGKRKLRDRSSSESSWMERGEGAETPDSHHRLTPNTGPKNVNSSQTSISLNSPSGTSKQACPAEDPPADHKTKPPLPSSSRLLPIPSINGEIGSEDSTLVCAKCGISFTGTSYDKQRKRPCCPGCWAASKTKEHPMIRFRKWIPCGECVGCQNTVNCGQCANCKHGLQSPESRRRICRKRRCICPIRKSPRSGGDQRSYADVPETFDDNMSLQNEVTDSQPSLKSSDTENFSLNVDDEEDDMSTDDDDDWHKKRKRRSCGECKACLCRKDCGTCDFCVDKPKFGGSNKKRQKCRLRQCQRQAMRHLLPFQMGLSEYGSDKPGRPRPHYTYSRKSTLRKLKGQHYTFDFTDDDEDSNSQLMDWSTESEKGTKPSFDVNVRNHQSSMQLNHSNFGVRNGLPDRVPHISNHNHLDQQSHCDPEGSYTGRDGGRPVEEDDDEEEEEEFPMITQIFSLAENPPGSGADVENQLMKLLQALRSSALPILWYAIMVEGPQLQLIQCSKQSSMADTTVLIDPGFCYQVTVQKQPLLPTHPLYDSYPAHLTSVTEVVNLLLGLEKYIVCHGLPPKELLIQKGPVILERASTCDFLVKKTESVCASCRLLR